MYYALTIMDNTITGIHESMTPYTSSTFVENPRFASHQVVTIQDPTQFQTGVDIRAYNEDGTMKDEVWCIENGYMALPPNMEIINGELVDIKKPIEEQSQSIKEVILQLKQENMEMRERLSTYEVKMAAVEKDMENILLIKNIESQRGE